MNPNRRVTGTDTKFLLRSSPPLFLSLTLVLVLAACAGTPAKEVSYLGAYVNMGAWDAETMIPEIQQKQYEAAVSYGMTAFLNPGIITPQVTDPEGMFEDTEAVMAYLSALADRGELTLRTFVQPVFKNPAMDTERFISKAVEYSRSYDTDMLRSFGVKIHPDVQRIEAMKIPLNISPIFHTDWADGHKPALAMLGEERTRSEFARFMGPVEAGSVVALAADVPSAPLSIDAPLLSVESVITRRDPLNDNSEVFPPGARGMTLEQALKAVTINPAWQTRMEDKLGSLEVGKYADLVVLDRNLFDIDPTEISEVNVLLTMMDGVVRHRDGM